MAPDQPLLATPEENEQLLRQAMGQQRGLTFRTLQLPPMGGSPRHALLVYVNGLASTRRLEGYVIQPLMRGTLTPTLESLLGGDDGWIIPAHRPADSVHAAVGDLARGRVLLHTSDMPQMVVLELTEMPYRDITPPETETSVTGPKEAFTEQLTVNLAQVRRRLPSPDLRLESIWIGTRAPVELVVAYYQGRPTRRMLRELRRRLVRVTQDGMQDLTEIMEAVSESALNMFPTVLVTERPDTVVQYLLAGRIAVLMENAPRALVVPALFVDLFNTPDDFYEWRPYVLFLRLLRFFAFIIAVPTPALYIAFTTYHLQALPTLLTLSLLAQREGAPLPAPVEAILLTVLFEILREAGVRLPRSIGPTVSIVGGLVIGEAAIRSGVASPAMVLTVSATAVSTFALASTYLANSATFLRLGFMFLASGFGFFGVLIAYLLMAANLSTMTSLGVPYMTPSFPLRPKDLATALGLTPRAPWGYGTIPSPNLIQEGEQMHERRE